MKSKLSAKQESFIKLMKEGAEFERRGFELLLKRNDYEVFFDALSKEGLFDPTRNPAPVESHKPGFYRILPWSASSYLEAVAKKAGELADLELAGKVMEVVRSVTNWRRTDGSRADNHGTWYSFAEILAVLPTQAISLNDIDLIPVWLSGKFDNTLPGHSLANRALPKFLRSEKPDDWPKAARILSHCTALRTATDDEGSLTAGQSVQLVIKEHTFQDLVRKNIGDIGERIGAAAAPIFRDRLDRFLTSRYGDQPSWLVRPAIESHPQNYDWREVENGLIDALRDTISAWLDSQPEDAAQYVSGMLESNSEITQRIAIFLINRHFDRLGGLIGKLIASKFFALVYLHELYNLLKDRFSQLKEEQKAGVLAVIRALPPPGNAEHPDLSQKRIQLRWLSALSGHQYLPADEWIRELQRDQEIGGIPEHPDLLSFHQTRWGPGPAPYSVEELVAMARANVLVDRINAFVPSKSWNGPTISALTDKISEAIGVAPAAFVDQIARFVGAKPPYQYALISGFKKVWDSWDGKQQAALDWSAVWPILLDFFEQLLGKDDFWTQAPIEDRPSSPTHDWIPPIISEFLVSGTRDDSKAIPVDLLQRVLPTIERLLLKSSDREGIRDSDPMTQAINAPRGKAIEALLNYALRVCRSADDRKKEHATEWKALQPIFDRELDKCRDANFEFSTLAGAYIANLQYLDKKWVEARFPAIFPKEFSKNCLFALNGMAYSPPVKSVYRLLVDAGVMEWALLSDLKWAHTREVLIQRLCLAFLWKQEPLTSNRFRILFDGDQIESLRIATRWFWSISDQPMTQEQRALVVDFWDRCIAWSKSSTQNSSGVLSSLGLLGCYLDAVGDRELGLLLAVAPHVSQEFNGDELIEELERLADTSPAKVGQVLVEVLKNYRPMYDSQERLSKLIRKLASNPVSRDDAIRSLELVRYIPGMIPLYSELTAISPS